MLLFNTYNIANDQTITSAQLEMSNGVLYPQERMNPTFEIVKTYRTLMSFSKGFNDNLSGPTIILRSFQDVYGILYFDLTNQEEELKVDQPSLNSNILCLVVQMLDLVRMLLFCMRKMSELRLNGKAVLKA